METNSTVLRSLTGKVRDEHRDLFRHATGASNLRISTDVEAGALPDLCEKLLALYQSDAYKASFPEIQNIVPVRDPAQIEALNARLLAAFYARNPDLNITVPEIINYSDNLYVMFGGAGGGRIYDDVYIGRHFEYLDQRGVDIATMGVDDLRRHLLILTDEEGNSRDRYSIYKSLVFDTTLDDAEGETFHFSKVTGIESKIAISRASARILTYSSLPATCRPTPMPARAHIMQRSLTAMLLSPASIRRTQPRTGRAR